MKRLPAFALTAALLILTACVKPSADLVPPVPVVDARICADPESEPAVRGSIVAPVGPEEVRAVQEHLESDVDVRQWGRRGWEIVGIARTMCAG